MTRQIRKGSVNVSVELYIIDDTDGTPELGVLFNTAGIDLNYRRDGAAVASIPEATLAALTAAHTDGGFLEVANGRYRFDLPDLAFATGVSQVTVGGTVTGMVVLPVTIQLVDFDPDDATRMGLAALPNAAADTALGLPISDLGGLNMDEIASNVAAILADTAVIGALGAGLSNIPWNAAWDAEVESEVNAALDTAISELGVGIPAATPTVRTALMLVYMALRNKTVVQTSGIDALEIYNNAGTLIAKKLLADDGSDYQEAKMS